jgi:ADP-heptose:LPS heptosyltransferase
MTKRFLIGQLGKFGDCLYATTLAKQIKHDFPESHITWAIMPKYKPILDLNPHVDSIWEVDADDTNYDKSGWEKFETEALRRKENGEFDEIYFSQVSPKNWINYTGTIRGTILSSYEKPITVSVEPVVTLSQAEIENVKKFAQSNNLTSFEKVVLFECSPGSGQSQVNLEFALNVCEEVIKKNTSICFVLSSSEPSPTENPQIIDGSDLSFRENVELTKYCTLMIGCSSGLSWISTSENAKKLPTIQLLDPKFLIYAGMHYDFEINGLDNRQIVEILNFDRETVVNCINAFVLSGIEAIKPAFHEEYKPNFQTLWNLTKTLIENKRNSSEIFAFIRKFYFINAKFGNGISRNFSILFLYTMLYGFFYRNIKASESGFFYNLRKFLKS